MTSKTVLMFVPFLSQHLLMTTVVRAEPILPLHLFISVGSTLRVLSATVTRRYMAAVSRSSSPRRVCPPGPSGTIPARPPGRPPRR